MNQFDIKSYRSACLIKGYFLDRPLPDEIRKAVDHLCDEIELILSDVNQIVEREMAREENEKKRKREERENNKSPADHSIKSAVNKDSDDVDDINIVEIKKTEILNTSDDHVQGVNKPKKKREWTPEQRKKQGDLLRARRAAGELIHRHSGKLPEPIAQPESLPAGNW